MSKSPERRLAFLAGAFFVLTFVVSIAGLILYGPVLNHPRYVLGAGSDTRISLGALCEVILVIANIGTAVTLYPILKRQSESGALGFIASRIVESTVIAVGLISLLAVVTLRKDVGGAGGSADAASLVLHGRALVAVHDWTFLVGPGFCVGCGNGLLLGYLMWKSRLVPSRMALLGVIGGPLIFASSTAVLFGAYKQTSGTDFLFSIPEIAWEASLGIYLLVKGFNRASPLLDGPAPATGGGYPLSPAVAGA